MLNMIHYGCSFTYGQDSGGFEIDDDTLSYPAYLSKMYNTTYTNKGRKGASNSTSFLKLYTDIMNGDVTSNDIVFFNISSLYRTIYMNNKQDNFVLLHGEEWRYQSIIPNYNSPKSFIETFDKSYIMYKKHRDAFYYQNELAFHLELLKNIYSAKSICNENDIEIVFVDLFGDLHKYKHYGYTDYKTINILDISERSFVHYIRKHHRNLISKSEHFESDGYELMAKYVYEKLQNLTSYKN